MVTPSVLSLLLPHPHDTLAALAYASYKHHELQTYAAIEAQTGHPPTPISSVPRQHQPAWKCTVRRQTHS